MANSVPLQPLKGPQLDELLRRLRNMELDAGGQIMAMPDDWCPPAPQPGIPLTPNERAEQEKLLKEMLKKRKKGKQ